MKVQHSKATTSSIFPLRLSKPLYWQPGVNFLYEAQQCDTTVVGAAGPLPLFKSQVSKDSNPHRGRNIWRRWENISASASETSFPRTNVQSFLKTGPAVLFFSHSHFAPLSETFIFINAEWKLFYDLRVCFQRN